MFKLPIYFGFLSVKTKKIIMIKMFTSAYAVIVQSFMPLNMLILLVITLARVKVCDCGIYFFKKVFLNLAFSKVK